MIFAPASPFHIYILNVKVLINFKQEKATENALVGAFTVNVKSL